jgi:porphobilinogen synthase
VCHVRFSAANLVLPLFVRPGHGVRQEISAMPGNYQLSLDMLADEIREAAQLGLGGVILFGIPEVKDALGSDATSDSGIIAQAVRVAKQAAPELLVITDVCFCEYTDHGHCGPLHEVAGRVDVDNDATLELLAKQALVHARAGADIVAPSGMMDGMVGAIRRRLDAEGFLHVPIMSYAAKYASTFYGPFREAAESAAETLDQPSPTRSFPQSLAMRS